MRTKTRVITGIYNIVFSATAAAILGSGLCVLSGSQLLGSVV